MFTEHYPALVGGYSAALLAWLVIAWLLRRIWPACDEAKFGRPWLELSVVFLAALFVIGIGQLYQHGIALPEAGPFKPVATALNQLFIFAPILLVIPLRRQTWNTAWLCSRTLGLRVLLGIAVALLAVLAYSFLRQGAGNFGQLALRIARYENLGLFVQVFLEDLTIAIFFVRLTAAVGKMWSLIVVALLFAAGHIPTMMATGASASEFSHLILDAAIGVGVLWVLRRSRDIVWFAFVHFCMDMLQFPRITFGH
jgi:hypothetical protein